MKKSVTIIGGILVAMLVITQLAMPWIAHQTISYKLQEASHAESLQVDVRTQPAFLLLFGKIDSIRVEADNAIVGNVHVSKLLLEGQNVRANLSNLDAHNASAISSADSLTLTGTITEADFARFLQEKWEAVENLQVSMTKDEISASGQTKLLGKMADVKLSGTVYEDNGMIYFHMTKLDVINSRFGKGSIGNLFGDMVLLDMGKLTFRAQFDDAVMHDGYVVLKASLKH